MANYVKATNFTAKDSLLTGNPAKIIKGAEIDDEYNAIATAIATKPDSNSPTLTGVPVAPTAAAGTNTTQIATTAFVQNVAGSLGTMSTQNANSVAITGGTIAGLSAALPVASGGTGSTTATGTGVTVLATSPTLVTPALGTPSALVGTNITGTAASLTAGVATRASGINATGASYLTGNAIGSYICTNFNVTPNGLGYTGTWNNYNQTNSSGQNTLYGWIRTA